MYSRFHIMLLAQTSRMHFLYHLTGYSLTSYYFRHDIYKWQRRPSRPRAVSFSGSTAAAPDPAFEHIHEPGGFRRNYLLLKGNGADGAEGPRMLNNFIDFLYIFGHFVSLHPKIVAPFFQCAQISNRLNRLERISRKLRRKMKMQRMTVGDLHKDRQDHRSLSSHKIRKSLCIFHH